MILFVFLFCPLESIDTQIKHNESQTGLDFVRRVYNLPQLVPVYPLSQLHR